MESVNPKKRLAAYRFNNHIFYAPLNRKAIYGNTPEFATFEEHFRHLNCDVLDSYASILRSRGYETDDTHVIKQYLRELKSDITYFLNIVKGGIQ